MTTRSYSLASFLAGAAVTLCASQVASWIQKTIWASKDDDDDDTAVAKAERKCWNIVEYSLTGALIYVMDDLGIYEALWDSGPSTVQELAGRTGYSERWLLELLSQSTSAGICQYDALHFSLRPKYAKLLLRPDRELKSMTGMFRFLHGLVGKRPEATIAAVKTGIGVDYDFGDSVIDGIDQKNRNFFFHDLIPDIICKVRLPSTQEPLTDLLLKGAKVADVGCGCGLSTVVLARAFPKSHFFAFEASVKSMEVLKKRIQESGISNVTVCNVASRTVSEGPYPGEKENNQFDFVYSHDLLHDMTDPRSLIKDVNSRLSKNGCWVIVDVKCCPTITQNMALPNAALNYGFSCLLCLSSATSCKNAEGLGTMGFHSGLAGRWMKEAGFEHFSELEIKSKPDNSCFIVA
jgi:FkbM family methyltransferase